MTPPTIFCCGEPIAVFRDTAVVEVEGHYSGLPHILWHKKARITRGVSLDVKDLNWYRRLVPNMLVRLPNSDTFEAILEFAE